MPSDVVANDPVVAEHTAAIKTLTRRAGQDIIEIGQRLHAVKERVDHGAFGPWVDREFGWSQPTAQRFMRVAQVFQNRQIDGFGVSALYALASGNVPDEIRERFITQAESGEPVRYRDVRAEIDAAKAPTDPPPVDDEDDWDGDDSDADDDEPSFVTITPRPTTGDYLRDAFVAEAQSVVDSAPPEAVAAFGAMLIEAQELPVTAELIAKTVSLLSRADLTLRDVRMDLARELIEARPETRREIDRAIALQTTMLSRCREILGDARATMRRVV